MQDAFLRVWLAQLDRTIAALREKRMRIALFPDSDRRTELLRLNTEALALCERMQTAWQSKLTHEAPATAEVAALRARLRQRLDAVRAAPGSPAAGKDRISSLLEETLAVALAATGATMGNVQLAGRDGLRIFAQRGFGPAFLSFFERVETSGSACAEAWQSATTVVVHDVQTSSLFSEEARQVMSAARARAVQSLPLFSRSCRPLGVVSVHYPEPNIPAERCHALEAMAPEIGDALACCCVE